MSAFPQEKACFVLTVSTDLVGEFLICVTVAATGIPAQLTRKRLSTQGRDRQILPE